MEWNFVAWSLAFFAWRVDIPWQAKEHPGSGVRKYLDSYRHTFLNFG